MSTVLIIVDSEEQKTSKAVAALKQAIASYAQESTIMSAISTIGLQGDGPPESPWGQPTIYCPLTLDLPEDFVFPNRQIYQDCRHIEANRTWATQQFGCKSGVGNYWLPAIATATQTHYGDIIGRGNAPDRYQQPVAIPRAQYQTLCHLTQGLLTALAAPPAVYLLQFDRNDREIVFDRLWPFPAASAIASVGAQQPDLFAYHWLCLTGQSL